MYISLDKLDYNKNAKIVKIDVENQLKRRLYDLGIIENSSICALYKSPLNNPRAYLIKESVIALRNEDTKNIKVMYKKEVD